MNVGVPISILPWHCIGIISICHPDRTTAILGLVLYIYKEATWPKRPIISEYIYCNNNNELSVTGLD